VPTWPGLAEVGALLRPCRQAEQTRQRRETIELLVDLRDRLARGRATAVEQMEAVQRWLAAPSWLERLLSARRRRAQALLEAVRAMDQGYAFGLSRIDEALGWQGVAEIVCLGRPFDPHKMTAVDVEETSDYPDGTVVDVYLPGYEWKGELLRLARVKVSRSPQSGQESS
jgi:molecular chaperone GrpE (heat shock protein)